MSRNDVTVLVELRLLPDWIEMGKRDLLEFAHIVRNTEPACEGIEIVQDLDDPTRLTMIEKWSSREAYEGPHLQTPHMRSFIDRSGRYFDGAASIAFCEGTVIRKQEEAGPAPPYGR